ncbi:MAG: hypothetical protein GTN53_16165 [Candidatus Aminicenantes bacterium]|nr:hypothetical protein [Candidatus Aminicenantes bacterium]NIM79880.1 hypothetical protein [Candidatus Aminicenantes bacterium]NIN19217.1 hypothetical protein [Candidatus Aminicenantes bacterium]NIN43122.1 hypothetical protein [Candidatus Aminicenantes bacterium]NIO82121.1 hypothetical protein [Candidatus Aminicenantes bacterium]
MKLQITNHKFLPSPAVGTYCSAVEMVSRSGGNIFPGGGNGVPERWKWYAGVVEMACLSGGKMEKDILDCHLFFFSHPLNLLTSQPLNFFISPLPHFLAS